MSNRYEVKKTDKKIGADGTEVYTVSRKGDEGGGDSVSVWRNTDGTCWCTSCSGPLAAMSRSCSHVKAVQRSVNRVAGQPGATKAFSRVADAIADTPQEADALHDQFERRRAGLQDVPAGKRERMAFYEKAMRDPRNHGALAMELAYLREKDDAAAVEPSDAERRAARVEEALRGALYHLRDTRSGCVAKAIEVLEAELGAGGVLPPADGVEGCGSDDHPTVQQLEKALAECRDAMPIPAPGASHEHGWGAAMGSPLDIPSYVRASVSALTAAAQARESELLSVMGEAYQVVGSLLSDLGKFDAPEARKVLDNLSQAKMVHGDVLPWASYERVGGDRAPHGPIVLALARAARPLENAAVMQHLERLIEAVREQGDEDLAKALQQLAEPQEQPSVAVRAAEALSPQEMVIYACGPINGRTDGDARGWRETVKMLWQGKVLDPMRRDYRGRELEPGIAEEIVAGDIEDIDNSNAILVYFDQPSVGTAMEIFYAKYVLGMYVAVINASDRPLSPWLVHHSDVQTRRIDEALTSIKKHLERNPQRAKPRFVPADWAKWTEALTITPATLAKMLGIKMQPILLTLMRAGQNVTVNQKLTEDQIAFLIQNGVDRQ